MCCNGVEALYPSCACGAQCTCYMGASYHRLHSYIYDCIQALYYNPIDAFSRDRIPQGIESDLNDVRNIITLEAGTHRRFDDCLFVFWPTLSPASSHSTIPVIYYLQASGSNTATEFHMRGAQILPRVQPYFLYCRFAWTIIQLVRKGSYKFFPVDPLLVELRVQKERKQDGNQLNLFIRVP